MIEYDKISQEREKTNCNCCANMSYTEEEQKNQPKKEHICLLSGVRIFHRGEHPRLPKPQECCDWKRRERP